MHFGPNAEVSCVKIARYLCYLVSDSYYGTLGRLNRMWVQEHNKIKLQQASLHFSKTIKYVFAAHTEQHWNYKND